jgi:hypothetical protein
MSLDTAPYIVLQELLESRCDRFTHYYMDFGDKNEVGHLLDVPKINDGICQLGTPNNAEHDARKTPESKSWRPHLLCNMIGVGTFPTAAAAKL